MWCPSGHHLIWGSRTCGTERAHVITGTVGVWFEQGGHAKGEPQGDHDSSSMSRSGNGRLGERHLPATKGNPGQQLGRTRDRDFAGGTGRAGCLTAGWSVTGRFISESSAAEPQE
jgi:hypothetical protein